MSLAAHLIELRRRLFISAAALVVGMVAGWILNELFVWDAIQEPVARVAEARGDDVETALVFPTLASAFDLKLQIAFTLGILLSSPVWLYQIFAFLVPGLNRRERRYTLWFFVSAIPLFFAGAAVAWFVLPNIVKILTSFVPEGSMSLLTAREYIDFVLKLVVAIGVAFVVPVFIVLLNVMGVLSAASIIKSWRVAVLVIVLFTAFATPSADVVSMFLLAVPMIGLYFAAWGIAHAHDRRVAKRQREEFGAEFS
ncbi:twin-arginine translocase subunit TatC [Agromyces sp. CFH 90414]|uniref:Sec-independent protein translocase protein TatC n=1 Tax=Agromyces agglutinans TaxID=2662258 RepID=A0A6I2F2M7_9MICO|nr:twin-arginine translocase subunit TatC [Agromyces agglutinans]MRG58421.1 twin-arginine translocase subunit TatC [Agromyces agglutinans]